MLHGARGRGGLRGCPWGPRTLNEENSPSECSKQSARLCGDGPQDRSPETGVPASPQSCILQSCILQSCISTKLHPSQSCIPHRAASCRAASLQSRILCRAASPALPHQPHPEQSHPRWRLQPSSESACNSLPTAWQPRAVNPVDGDVVPLS